MRRFSTTVHFDAEDYPAAIKLLAKIIRENPGVVGSGVQVTNPISRVSRAIPFDLDDHETMIHFREHVISTEVAKLDPERSMDIEDLAKHAMNSWKHNLPHTQMNTAMVGIGIRFYNSTEYASPIQKEGIDDRSFTEAHEGDEQDGKSYL